MRKPRGFHEWDLPVGVLFVRQADDGGWIVLAAEPNVKVDNKHMDRRPHMHIGGWDSDNRRPLREDLTAAQAAEAIRSHLTSLGYIDVRRLEAELQ